MEEQVNEPLADDEQMDRRMEEKITVYEDMLTVEFKLELEVDVE
ncbi:MAG: integrase [Lachnospiraceae bacterium]|nr:integrase [Lachnospiraceae bacterium]